MNQNDIGRQHRQTYNFSPSVPLLAPTLSPPPPSLPSSLRALVCVGQPTTDQQQQQTEFCRKSGSEILPTFQTLFVLGYAVVGPKQRHNLRGQKEDTVDDGLETNEREGTSEFPLVQFEARNVLLIGAPLGMGTTCMSRRKTLSRLSLSLRQSVDADGRSDGRSMSLKGR